MGSRDHLVEKIVTDKNGHRRRVRVRPDGFTSPNKVTSAAAPPSSVPSSRSEPQSPREFAIDMLAVSEEVFAEHFTPEKIYAQAGRIYDYMSEHGTDEDSVSREALFVYASEELNIEYEELYNRWMNGETGGQPTKATNGLDPATMTPAQAQAMRREFPGAFPDIKPDLAESRRNAIEMSEVNESTFDRHFTPEKIRDNAWRIYTYMDIYGANSDSVAREALFWHAADSLGVSYDDLYNRWINKYNGGKSTEEELSPAEENMTRLVQRSKNTTPDPSGIDRTIPGTNKTYRDAVLDGFYPYNMEDLDEYVARHSA